MDELSLYERIMLCRSERIANRTLMQVAVDLAKEINKHELFRHIVLHGSVARGREHKNSDIDILFIEWPEKKEDYAKRKNEAYSIIYKSPVLVDACFFKENEFFDEKQMVENAKILTDPMFYFNAIFHGKLFDGNGFSRDAAQNESLSRWLCAVYCSIKRFFPDYSHAV